ncbi:MAG: NACHT domain-containing protein [Anaerolineales bacterium]|nr:NACHT domain-containing protein [Anaerolineales bacterium]MCB8936836.1 NACHT domain-containing protein [Ardenticatenaceae bacterium]
MAQNKRPSSNRFKGFRKFFRKSTPQNDQKERLDYLQELFYQHRSFDVKGISAPGEATLPLAQVFVDVGLSAMPGKASTNPIPAMQKNAREKRYSIWRFLQSEPDKRPKNLVVLGAPGTGKTTLLKHLALTLTQPAPNGHRLAKSPIFLPLRDVASQIQQDHQFSLQQAVQLQLSNRKVNISLDWLANDLENGRCLIMLDGLDEVADPTQRQHVIAWVQRQIRQQPYNQFIITSRPFGYENNPLPDALPLEVKPFTIEQMRKFVQNWYLANEIQTQGQDDPGVRREATSRATDLLHRLHQTPALLEMGINPLLLTMIATIHHYRSSLPDQRVALYHEICDVFLGKRQQARGIRYELTPSQKKRVLQSLAFAMMRRSVRNIPRADAADIIDPALRRVNPNATSGDFLQMIANTSGLLVEHTSGVYSFAHLTFQEYLTAVHIKEERLEQELLKQVDDSWWHETIRLYAAQANATNIIRACVMRKTASISALTLAVECLDEALEVEDDFRKIPGELLRSIEDENPEIRRIGAEVRLQLRLRNLVRLDETTYADTSLVTQAEYQLFLDEMRAQGRYVQPDHWQAIQFSKGAGQEPVAGIRPSDAEAFCLWLSERNPGPWRYRLPNAQEISRPPLNNPEDDTPIGFWFQKNGQMGLNPSPMLQHDRALVENLQRQLEDKLLNDLLAFQNVNEADENTQRLQKLILEQARRRAYSLLDLERRLPFAENGGEEIGRFLSLIQDRNSAGTANDLEQALFHAKVSIDNPSAGFAEGTMLEEIVIMSNRLLDSLGELPFSDRVRQLMRQLQRALADASRQLQNAQQSLQAEFLSHREIVRHINQALLSAQSLLDELSYSRADARIRLRVNALYRSLTLLQRHSQPTASEATRPRLERLKIIQLLVDLYVDLAILENRDGDKMMALEGIRIIRETMQS